MLIRTLRKAGVTSDMAFLAGGLSIVASIVAWRVRSDDNSAHAERLGIFVGLWAPTFMVIGASLKVEEDANNTQVDPAAAWDEVRGTAQAAASKVSASVN